MLTTEESHLLPAHSSPPPDGPIETTQTRRHELTNLILAEKNYFLRTANMILRNGADAEDVLHNSFCAAWNAMGSFRGDSAMKTWFSRIVSNHAVTLLRKKKTGGLVFLEENPEYLQTIEQRFSAAVEDPEKIVVRREALRLLNKHVRYLPAETRIIFWLHFADDHPIGKIAEMRGKSSLAVTAHLQRGKAILRKRVRKVPARRISAKRVHDASA